jgi:hypothetical protein
MVCPSARKTQSQWNRQRDATGVVCLEMGPAMTRLRASLLLCALALVITPARVLAAGGTPADGISGHVTEAGSGAALPGVIVQVYDGSGNFTSAAATDERGFYAFAPLASGTYFARTFADLAHRDQLYAAQACSPTCVVTAGTPIAVGTTGTATAIDFALALETGHPISGHITDAASGNPLRGVTVWALDANGAFVALGVSATDGSYTVRPASPGAYYLTTSNDQGYFEQGYNNHSCVSNCGVAAGNNLVAVAAGLPTTGIDFALDKGAGLSGTVTNGSGNPIPYVVVDVFDAAGRYMTSATAAPDGRYSTTGLPAVGPTSYYARTNNRQGYIEKLYNGGSCAGGMCGVTTGAPITLSGTATTANIDFVLEVGGQITGTVTNAAATQNLGVQGVTVQVFDAAGALVTQTSTGSDGTFTTTGLPGATYFARTMNAQGLKDRLYSAQLCAAGQCNVNLGSGIVVSAGTVTGNVDFALEAGAQLEGLVLDAVTQLPVSNLEIGIYDVRGIRLTSSRSDVTGRFTTTGLISGTYYARTRSAAAYGYLDQLYSGISCQGASCAATLGTPIVVGDPEVHPGVNFTLTRGGTIAGIVTSASTGLPLGGVTVSVYTAGGTFVGGGATNASGQYGVAGLLPGSYRVLAWNRAGYVDQLFSGISCPCNVAAGSPVQVNDGSQTAVNFALNLVPIPSHISGRVTNLATGAGVPFIQVAIYSAPSGAYVTSAFSDASGNYTTPILAAGNYFAHTFNFIGLSNKLYNNIPCNPDCPVQSGTSINVPSGTTVTGIDFQLARPPRITGRVTNAITDAGLPGVSVLLFYDFGVLVMTGYTDYSGSYSSFALSPGTYYARTSNAPGYLDQLYSGQSCAPGCAVTNGTAIIVGSGESPGIDFALTPSARITGSVRSAIGNLAFLSVEVYDSSGVVLTRVFTDGSGNYSVSSNLRTGTYYLRTSNVRRFVDQLYDGIPCVTCDVTTGTPVMVTEGSRTSNINFRLDAGGTISGKVTVAAPSANLFGMAVQIFDSEGTLVTTTSTDGSGNYSTAAGLPTGEYYARTSNSLGYADTLYSGVACPFGACSPTMGTAIHVTAGTTTSLVNFALPELGLIQGVVRDAVTGADLNFATVQIYSRTGALMATVGQFLPSGYSAGGLTAGTYYAVASRPGYKRQVYDHVPFTCLFNCIVSGTPIVVEDGGKVTGVDFALTAGGRISGHVTDSTTRAGLFGIAAEIYDDANVLVARTSTDGSGNYVSDAGLPTGTYYLRTRNARGYVDRLFDAMPCASCTPSTGTPISVVDGVTTPNVNLDLTLGKRIGGTVMVNGRPINATFQFGYVFEGPDTFVTTPPGDASGNYTGGTYVTVNIFDNTGAFVTSGAADASGNYVTKAGLPDGSYYAVTATTGGVFNKVHKDFDCPLGCDPTAGTPITISSGVLTGGVNFDLVRGGRIAGAVTDASTGLPLRGVWVDIYDASNQHVATALTTNSGGYETYQGLTTGTYYARTRDVPGYRSGCYDDVICPPANGLPGVGTPISVTSPSTTRGVDFGLTPLVEPIVTRATPR